MLSRFLDVRAECRGARAVLTRAAITALVVVQAAACTSIGVAHQAGGASPATASYVVIVQSLSPPRFAVRAELPLVDDTLRMDNSRPCNLESLCSRGWPLFVSELRVTNADGRALPVEAIDDKGWVVRDSHGGRVILDYAVDYRMLADSGWPAPREAAFSDGSTLFTAGRPLFVGTSAARATRLRFVLPRGVHVSGPWLAADEDGQGFVLADFEELTNNALVIGEQPAVHIRAGRFTIELALFGRWSEQRELVTRLIEAHLGTFTRLFGSDERAAYLAAFLEGSSVAGEAFISSYAISGHPRGPVASWGRLIGHEIFHYWNGHRIRGLDYTSSQWFQEGVTEYYAILSMARNGFTTTDEALSDLSRHLRAHRDLAASLAASGNRKNRAFYGSAAMAAFALDLIIRDASHGQRSLDDVMREMWREFGGTNQPYTHADVIRIVSSAAGTDLGEFFRTHVERDAPLPMDAVLPLVGLKLVRDTRDEEAIIEDPAASRERTKLWSSLLAGDG